MTLRTLNYGNYGIFLIMGHAGFCPSTDHSSWLRLMSFGMSGLGFVCSRFSMHDEHSHLFRVLMAQLSSSSHSEIGA